MSFATKLQQLRTSAGLSQTELASKAGVSIDSLRNWEQGRSVPRVDTAAKLAVVIGVSVDDLVTNGGDEPKKPRPRKGK